MLRKIISRLANFYPNVVFYSKTTRVRFNETLNELPTLGNGKAPSSVGRAALAICAACGENMKVGDVATAEFEDVVVDTQEMGNYRVVITKTR